MVKKKGYMSSKEILATGKFEAIGVMVAEGEVLGAGAIVGGVGGGILGGGGGTEVEGKNTALKGGEAEGVLLYGVDATKGAEIGTMIIRGNINLGKIEAPVGEAIEALGGRILFMDGVIDGGDDGEGGN